MILAMDGINAMNPKGTANSPTPPSKQINQLINIQKPFTINRGARYLTGENVKVVWANF
jgi:hypothetical protein